MTATEYEVNQSRYREFEALNSRRKITGAQEAYLKTLLKQAAVKSVDTFNYTYHSDFSRMSVQQASWLITYVKNALEKSR